MVPKKKGKKCSLRKPHFFKVLLGDFAQHLKIPQNFLKHISDEESKMATLQGPSGGNWRVELGTTVQGTFLTAGWQKFVRDHSLKQFEFLVFQYDGNMHFTVLIFDTTACEREDVFAIRPRRRRTPFRGKCLPSSDRSGSAKAKIITEQDLEVPLCMIGNSTGYHKGYMSTRRQVTAEERLKAQEVANSFTSVFPYCIRRMGVINVYRTFLLRLPAWFSRVHLPRKRMNIVLRDPNGKAWVVVFIPSLRDCLSAGWSAFARGNNLEEGDYCVFELIGPVELQVHIFRVVEEISPIVRRPRIRCQSFHS